MGGVSWEGYCEENGGSRRKGERDSHPWRGRGRITTTRPIRSIARRDAMRCDLALLLAAQGKASVFALRWCQEMPLVTSIVSKGTLSGSPPSTTDLRKGRTRMLNQHLHAIASNASPPRMITPSHCQPMKARRLVFVSSLLKHLETRGKSQLTSVYNKTRQPPAQSRQRVFRW